MTTPYTYLIKCLPENKVYYGVRYARGCSPDDLWTSYYTSSSVIKEKISTYGKDSFVIEIRQIFDSVKKARQWENRVLKRIDAVCREDFYNKTDNISISPMYGNDNPATRPETKQKISQTLKITAPRGDNHPRKIHPEKYTHISSMLKGRSNTWSAGALNPMHRPDVKEKFKQLRGAHKNNGRVQTEEEKEQRRLSNIGKTRLKYACVHCGKLVAKNMLLKWHDDNCKLRKENG